MTLNGLLSRFPDEAACRAHFFALRWPGGKVTCPRCGEAKRVYARKGKTHRWVCKACNKNGYGFSLTSGTVFEDTKCGLRTWFQVLFLMLNAKKGKSALEIKRLVFNDTASYETVWYMCHRLRAAMKDPHFQKLTGQVEVDETYVGGKEKNKHKNKRLNVGAGAGGKFAVVGAISRKGNVTCQVIERATAATLTGFVNEVVSSEVSLVATDENPSYQRLTKDGFPHETVKHNEGEYVRGEVHTAHLDSFWSLLKRGIMGSYHKVSWGYLPLYVNEFSYRHNNRQLPNHEVFDRVLESS